MNERILILLRKKTLYFLWVLVLIISVIDIHKSSEYKYKNIPLIAWDKHIIQY